MPFVPQILSMSVETEFFLKDVELIMEIILGRGQTVHVLNMVSLSLKVQKLTGLSKE